MTMVTMMTMMTMMMMTMMINDVDVDNGDDGGDDVGDQYDGEVACTYGGRGGVPRGTVACDGPGGDDGDKWGPWHDGGKKHLDDAKDRRGGLNHGWCFPWIGDP